MWALRWDPATFPADRDDGDDGVTVVEMAGLGRSESAKLPEELAELAGDLHDRAPTAAAPDAVPSEGAEK
ncbi:hypothetical protein CLM85_30390 [Streptomyces albidoflavus]|nr:hypothetical protein CLM85_30390 [Streptomyces albidoflavus]